MLLRSFLIMLFLTSTSAFAISYDDPYIYNGLMGKIHNLSTIPNEDLRVEVRICKFTWYRKCKTKFVKSKIKEDGSYELKSKKAYKWGDELYITHYILDTKTKEKYELVPKLSGRRKNLETTVLNFTFTDDLRVIAE